MKIKEYHNLLYLVFLFLMGITITACTQNNAPQPGEVNVEYTPKHINLIRPIVEPEKIYRMSLVRESFEALPQEMAKMRNLQILKLVRLKINDWESSFKVINSFQNLKEIQISGIPISKIPIKPENLPHLKTINLRGSRGYCLKEEIENLSQFDSLESFIIGGLDINSFPENISLLKNLKFLEFGFHAESFDYANAFDLLTTLPNLNHIDIAGADLTNSIDNLRKLNQLSVLALFNCKVELDKLFNSIHTWPKLERLELKNMSLDKLPSSITQLQSLKSLSLYHNPDLDHASLFRQLAKLPHLEELDISETNTYTEAKDSSCQEGHALYIPKEYAGIFYMPKELGDLKKLKKLHLSNLVSVDFDTLLDRLVHLKQLEYLNLSGIGSIDGQGVYLPASLSKMENLKELIIDFSGPHPFDLVEQMPPNLEKLDFSSAHFDEYAPLPEVIFTASNLKSLNLNDCKLKEFPKGILKLKELEHLDLGNNQIRELPEAITQLKNLKYLNLMGTIISTSQEKRDKIEKMLPNTLVFFGEYRAYDPDWMDK